MPHTPRCICILRVPVSISGETTAPLPPGNLLILAVIVTGFQSQARPPLPCHPRWDRLLEVVEEGFNLRRDHRSLATHYYSTGTPRAECYPDRSFVVCAIHMVSISGETTAPLPLSNGVNGVGGGYDVSISGETTAPLPLTLTIRPYSFLLCFNLRRDHRSLATVRHYT